MAALRGRRIKMTKSSPASDLYGTTLQAFIAQLQPKEWNRPEEEWEDRGNFNCRWDPRKFLDWPPDAFLLTSLLLEITGAYRAAATLHGPEAWPKPNWGAVCTDAAVQWRKWLYRDNLNKRLPPAITRYVKIIHQCQDTFLNDLYDVETWTTDRRRPDDSVWRLCLCLMELHAIADETMRGVGTVYSPKLSLTLSEFGTKRGKNVCDGIERVHMMANLLLTLRGTLSRIGKHRGIVLPKTRTPQVGLTIRTFSHYLSFHQTEVDVAWRAVPWTNIDENTVNALIVPWPYRVVASDFHPELTPQTFKRLGNIRYFSYEPGGRADEHVAASTENRRERDRFDPTAIVDAVKVRLETNRVHLIVFPEAALRVEQLDQLKEALGDALQPHEMPLIISGLAGRNQDDAGTETSFNRVCLSTYFAEKWYDMTQHKHHRWRLDPAQIANYGLGGVLSGTRNWWEAIPIPRRRLSFLTSNAWLTLAPLICEDLARLDPVSDLIRGVGPTLLIALLLDGPQLTNRWPARYAGVFAEDPGTSVLTVTALGMSQRSRPDDVSTQEAEKSMQAVALWKDQFTGWKTINVSKEQSLAILTVATRWVDDDTVDSRSQGEDSAVFVYQGLRLTEAPVSQTRKSDTAPPAAQPSVDEPSTAADEKRVRKDNLDMCELSLYTFFVDALVDSEPGSEGETLRLLHHAVAPPRKPPETGGPSGAAEESGKRVSEPSPANLEIADLCRYSIWSRTSVPSDIPTAQFLFATTDVTNLVTSARAALRNVRLSRTDEETEWDEPWTALVDASKAELVRRSGLIRDYDSALERQLADWTREYMIEAHEAQQRNPRYKEEDLQLPDEEQIEDDLARLYLATPSSLLWAVHNRLSIVRRAGHLRRAHARLLSRVEEALRSHDRKAYQGWRDRRRETRTGKH
jgi:hypothetical protein